MKKLALLAFFALVGASTAFATSTQGDPGPWGNSVYVRGGFNDWTTADPMTWDSSNQQFDAVLALDAGTWEFKIADDTWANPDFGPLGDPNVTLGTASDIGTAIGANFSVVIAAAGDYLFTLYDIAGDLQSGQLLVTQVVPVPAALLLFGSGLLGFGFFRRRD